MCHTLCIFWLLNSADVGAIDAWIFLWNHLVHWHWSNVLLRCPRLDQQPAFRARIYTARRLLRVCLTILTTCEVPSSIFVTDLESGCCLHRIEIQEITRYRYGLWVVVFCWYPLPSIAQEDGEDAEDAEDDEDGDSAVFLGRSSDALAKLRPWRRLLKL